jgi:hypothetical protein
MRRLVLLVCALATIATGCGGDPAAAPSPTPVRTFPSGVFAPVDRARNTVDQLNQHSSDLEQRTGGSDYPTTP